MVKPIMVDARCPFSRLLSNCNMEAARFPIHAKPDLNQVFFFFPSFYPSLDPSNLQKFLKQDLHLYVLLYYSAKESKSKENKKSGKLK